MKYNVTNGNGGAAGPAHDVNTNTTQDVSTLSSSIDAMLDSFLSAFNLSDHTSHSAEDCHECLVCYEKKDARGGADHGNFLRCGHGKHLCAPCSEKLLRCPLCRDIKEGYESYVLATEALQGGRPCDDQWDAGRTSLYLPAGADDDDSSPSCSAAPAPTMDVSVAPTDALNLGADVFFGVEGGMTPPPLAGPAPPSWAVVEPVETINEDDEAMVIEEEEKGEESTEPEPELTATGRPKRRAAQSPAWRQHDNEATPEPEAPSRALARKRPPASPSPQPSFEDEPPQRTNHVSREPDNPFAAFNVPDYDVEQLPFAEFQQLMKSKRFTPTQMAAGKRFRKRLKNRRQVMLYARKQQVGARSLQAQNSQLTRKVEELARENSELRDKNLFLEQTLEYLEQARTDAVNECQSLQQQMHQLTTTMNDLGFFDNDLVNME